MAQEDGVIRIVTKITTKDAEESLSSLEYKIKKSAKEIDSLRAKMDKLRDQKMPTQEYENLEKKLTRTLNTIKELEKEQGKLSKSLAGLSTAQLQERKIPLNEEVDKTLGNLGKIYEMLSELDSKMSQIKEKDPDADVSSLEAEYNDLLKQYDALQDKNSQTLGQIGEINRAIEFAEKIDKAKTSAEQLEGKLEELEDAGKDFVLGKDTAQYKTLERQLQYQEEAIVKAGEHYQKLKDEASGVTAEEERLAQIQENAVVGNQRIVKVMERRKQLAAEIKDMERAEIGTGYQQYDSAKRELAELDKEIKKYANGVDKMKRSYKELGDTAKKSFEKINKSTKKSDGLLSTFSSRFKGLALSLLIFNNISKAFNAMMSGIREGIGNLARFSNPVNTALSSMKSSLTQLKNSLATAFAPILTMIAPILTTFINMISRVVTQIGMLIAALTGQKMFTKATAVQEQYAESLGNTASSAKDANKQLSSLDKLNNLSGDNAGGSGGGGGGGGLTPGDMFEIVPIENNMLALAERIKKIFTDMFAPLKAAWAEYGDSIRGTLSKILQDFIGFGARIGQSTYEWFKNLDWGPLLSSVDNLLKSLEPLIDLILGGLAWAWENVLLPFGKWTIESAVPVVLDLIAAALDVIREVLVALEPLGTWLWENFLQPLGEWAGEIVIGALETVTDLLGKFGDWVSEHQEAVENMAIIVGSFAAAWGLVSAALAIWNGIGVITTGVAYALGGAITFLTGPIGLAIAAIGAIIAIGVLLYKNWDEISAKAKEVWEFIKQKFQEFDDYLQNIFSHDWTYEFGLLGNVINGFNKVIESVWESAKQIFKGIIDFVVGVFAADWSRAWNGIKDIFGGIWNGLVAILKAPVNAIIGIINGLVRGVVSGINSISRMLNSLRIDIPDWVPGIGGGRLGFNLPTWNAPQIPYLATGAVIPANKEFLAVLGDQKHGTNIEAPLATIEDAVQNVLNRNGGAGGAREITIKVPVEIDGKVLFELVKRFDLEQFNRTGQPSFQV